MNNTLKIVSDGAHSHKAIIGGHLVVDEQPTEIQLVEELQKVGIWLRNWTHTETKGETYPFTWTWEKNDGNSVKTLESVT